MLWLRWNQCIGLPCPLLLGARSSPRHDLQPAPSAIALCRRCRSCCWKSPTRTPAGCLLVLSAPEGSPEIQSVAMMKGTDAAELPKVAVIPMMRRRTGHHAKPCVRSALGSRAGPTPLAAHGYARRLVRAPHAAEIRTCARGTPGGALGSSPFPKSSGKEEATRAQQEVTFSRQK